MGTLFWIIYALILAGLILTAWAAYRFAPWLPTRRRDLQRIVDIGGMGPDDLIYDLGCGTGGPLFYIAKTTGARAIGVELSPFVWFIGWVRSLLPANKNVRIRFQNLFQTDISDATMIFVYVLPDNAHKVTEKVLRDAPAGIPIISNTFEIPGLEHIRTDKPTENDLPIYLYRNTPQNNC